MLWGLIEVIIFILSLTLVGLLVFLFGKDDEVEYEEPLTREMVIDMLSQTEFTLEEQVYIVLIHLGYVKSTLSLRSIYHNTMDPLGQDAIYDTDLMIEYRLRHYCTKFNSLVKEVESSIVTGAWHNVYDDVQSILLFKSLHYDMSFFR